MKPQPLNFIDVHIGSRFRLFRMAQKLTQADLAACLHVDVTRIQDYESGRAHITAEHFYALTQKLQLDVATLFEGLGRPGEHSLRQNIYALNDAADAKFIRDYMALTRDQKNDMQDYLRTRMI